MTCPEPLRQTALHPRNAAEVQDGSQYSVLLIITDGVISDMAQTKEAIVNVSWGPGPAGAPSPSFRETLGPGFSSPTWGGTTAGFLLQHLEGLLWGGGHRTSGSNH